MYNQYDNGLDLNFETDPEERKRRLARMAGITGSENFGDIAGKMIDNRLAPINKLVEDPEAALRERFAPIQQAVENPEEAFRKRLLGQTQQPQPMQPQPTQPQIVAGPQVPTMPDETDAETQRLLRQNQLAQGVPTQPTPMAPAVPETIQQPTEQQTATGAPTGPAVPEQTATTMESKAVEMPKQQVVAPTGPAVPTVERENEMPTPQLGQLPQAGPGVQVAAAPGGTLPETKPAVAPVPQWSQELVNSQGDVTKLHSIAGNPNYPEDVRKLAGEITAKMYKDNLGEKQAMDLITKAMSGQDPKALNNVMNDLRKDRAEGSYVKAILFARLGLNELAKEEQQKLGAGNKIGQSMIDGKQYTVEYDGQGGVKRAWDASGTRVGDEGLAKISAGGMKPGTHAFGYTGDRAIVPQGQPGAGEEVVPYTNSITREVGYVFATGPNKGKDYTGSTPMAKRVDTHSAIALNDAMIKFQTAPTIGMATEMLKLAGQTDTGDGKTIANTMNRIQQLSPAIFNQVKGMMPAPTVQTQPSNVPQAQPQAQPSGPINPAQVQPQAQPVMGGGGSLTTQKAQQEAGVDINKQQIIDRNKSNQTYSDSLAANRQTAVAQGSTINRLQTAIDRNPNFWGIDTNSSAWRAFVDVNSTNPQKAESLDTLARNMNIPKEQRPAFDAVMNDYRNLQVNAITGSGLTASQTNTERESQRVMGTIGSISDRPAAAKATLEYAKAKIEYADAKAKEWAQARKTNPGIDRLDFETNFDATKGEQIFQKANERMNKILGGPGETPKVSEGQTSVSKTGKPIVYRNNRWEYQ